MYFFPSKIDVDCGVECSKSWDESNAFCNIPQEDAPALLAGIAPTFSRWLQKFYNPMWIRSCTPYGMTNPFPMVHGGGQGDSGGVGA